MTIESAAPLRTRQERFFTVMSVLAAATVFAGFSRTYYLKGVFGAKALTPFFHLHGAVMSSWIILFVVQVALVRSRHVAWHRRLGLISLALVPAMVTIGVMAGVDAARRGFSPPNGPPPLVFLVIPLVDLFVFASLVTAALLLRRRPDDHRRLMLLATISILTPAIARLPLVASGGPPAFLGITDLFIVACLLFDKVSRGKVHRAFLWGGLFIIASQPLRFALANTEAWMAFARWMTR